MDTNDLAKVISGGSNKDDPCDEPAEVGVSFASQMIQRDAEENSKAAEPPWLQHRRAMMGGDGFQGVQRQRQQQQPPPWMAHRRVMTANIAAANPGQPFRRGSDKKVGKYTKDKCAKGHGLIKFRTPHERFKCDRCERSQENSSIMYGCNICDYDICDICEGLDVEYGSDEELNPVWSSDEELNPVWSSDEELNDPADQTDIGVSFASQIIQHGAEENSNAEPSWMQHQRAMMHGGLVFPPPPLNDDYLQQHQRKEPITVKERYDACSGAIDCNDWDKLNELLINGKDVSEWCDQYNGDYLLHKLAGRNAKFPLPLLEKLLSLNSEAAGKKDGRGQFPLHYAVYRQADMSVIKLLVHAFKGACSMLDGKKNLVLGFACEVANDINTRLPGFAGHRARNNLKPDNLELCQLLYEATDSGVKDFRDQDRDSLCCNATNPAVRRWASTLGTVYGQYRINGKHIYRSETCVVYLADDELLKLEISELKKHVNENADKAAKISKLQKNVQVCIKVMQNQENFDSEKKARKNFDSEQKAHTNSDGSKINLEDSFVVKIISTHEPEDKHDIPIYNSDQSLVDEHNKEWALIMPAGDKSLDRAIADDNIAGSDQDEIVRIAKSLAHSLKHIHGKNLIHCDVKPRNFVRFGEQWKLIDLDAANKAGDTLKNTNKFSSGYTPPEMARLLWCHHKKDKIRVRVGAKDLSGNDFESSEPIHIVKEVWSRKRQNDSADKRDLGDVCISVMVNSKDKDIWFSRSDVVTAQGENENEFDAHGSFDSWSFGVVLFQLCTGRKLFSDLGTSDDNLKDRADQDRLMEWSERSLNTALLKLGDDEFGIKNLLEGCLQPRPKDRPTMSQILEHEFLDGDGEYWKQVDGTLAVPLSTGQTAFIGILGIIVLFFTCLHVCKHIFPTNTVNDLRTLLDDKATTADRSDSIGLIIDFSSHHLFNQSVAAWQTAAEAAVDKITSLQDLENAASQLDGNMRGKLELTGPLLNIAWYCWITAAMFLSYSRLAKTSWPKITKDTQTAEEIYFANEKKDKQEQNEQKDQYEKKTWENFLQGKSGWSMEKGSKTIYKWKGKKIDSEVKAIAFEENYVDKNNWVQEQKDAKLLFPKCTSCVRRCGTLYQDWQPDRSYAVKEWKLDEKLFAADELSRENSKSMDNVIRKVNVRTMKKGVSSCCCRIPMYSKPKLVEGKNVKEILSEMMVTDMDKKFLRYQGWPLDEFKPLAAQVSPNDTVFVANKRCGHMCFAAWYKVINLTFACTRWLFFNLLGFFSHHGKVNEEEEEEEESDPIFPELWINSSALLLVTDTVLFVRSFYGLAVLTDFQLKAVYTASVVWTVTGMYYYIQCETKRTLYETFKIYACSLIYGRMVQFYVNMPWIAFNLLFISPTILFVAYGYDNYDYIASSMYQPLKDAISPVMMARVALQQRRLSASIDNFVGDDFLQNNETIWIAEQTLELHSAKVVQKAAEVHTVFQIMVAGILSDGSPNILLYMLSYAIMFDTSQKVLLSWGPKIGQVIEKWAKTGMEKDVRTDLKKLWQDFKKKHLANTMFFFTDYIVSDYLEMGPTDMLTRTSEIQMILLGILVAGLSWKWWQGRYWKQGRILGLWIICAPFVLNKITGPEMFKVFVWMSMTFCLNPQAIWKYLSYGLIVSEILKAPKKWKLLVMEKMKRKKEGDGAGEVQKGSPKKIKKMQNAVGVQMKVVEAAKKFALPLLKKRQKKEQKSSDGVHVPDEGGETKIINT